jgi:Glycosyl hydrolase family 20, domain 2
MSTPIVCTLGMIFRYSRTRLKNPIVLLVIALSWRSVLSAQPLTVSTTHHSRVIDYGLRKLAQSIRAHDYNVQPPSLTTQASANIVILLKTDDQVQQLYPTTQNLVPEGYQLIHRGDQLWIIGADETGAMYGTLDVAEQLQHNGKGLQKVLEKREEPRLSFRAIKFNLPIMAYRSSLSLTQQQDVVFDPKFWESFLDMMAADHFNVLSLWSMHPFHYMVRAKNFPEACPFDDTELAAMKKFWTSLFKMAHDRGIETYIINWNIFVPPSFAYAHNVALYSAGRSQASGSNGDTSKIIEQYTRETITQVIDEYPDLNGLGITLGERMGGMTPQERREWMDRTIFAGIKAANRKIKFVYRAPLSANTGSGGSTSEENDVQSRRHIEQQDMLAATYVEFKFNWSHGHSSPRLFMVHGGKLTDKYYNPLPTKYKYVWTVRNEDFYRLRWGNSDFIREFIRNNGQEYVAGCFLGSEVFTPAMDYTSLPGPHKTWDYHFQRQWLWYAMWGRLMYDPDTPDSTFERMLDDKYGKGTGHDALEAWKIATNNQLEFAAFHMGTADAQLYSEGFSDWDVNVPARLFSVNNVITHPVLDTISYINIKDWITNGEKTKTATQMSPLQLAAQLDEDNARLLTLIEKLEVHKLPPGAEVEVNDMRAWYWFGRYFSDKIRAAVAVARYRYSGVDERAKAVDYLKHCSSHWANYANAVARYNKEVFPLVISGDFSLKAMQTQVDHDIDLAMAPASPAIK